MEDWSAFRVYGGIVFLDLVLDLAGFLRHGAGLLHLLDGAGFSRTVVYLGSSGGSLGPLRCRRGSTLPLVTK